MEENRERERERERENERIDVRFQKNVKNFF